MEAKTFKTNVNARDAKGWNALAIASFRHCFNALRVLLAEGGDPHAKNQYGMSAVDFAQDELDAAMVKGTGHCRYNKKALAMVYERGEYLSQASSCDEAARMPTPCNLLCSLRAAAAVVGHLRTCTRTTQRCGRCWRSSVSQKKKGTKLFHTLGSKIKKLK